MIASNPIAVVIATSKGRTELLGSRSLRSVYEQVNVNPIEVVIVDNNPVKEGEEFSEEFKKISETIDTLREKVLEKTYRRYVEEIGHVPFWQFFKTTLLKNTKTPMHSGTGAWNTAIFYLARKYRDRMLFVTILDDDDEYREDYLSACVGLIKEHEKSIAAVFPFIVWKDAHREMIFSFFREQLTQRAFFIGNPGVQSSNMCIRLDVLVAICGFDEALHSATDRDLMIRFLDYLDEYNSKNKEKLEIKIIPRPLVIHYADRPDRVTSNRILKKKGLDIFYEKYRSRFSEEDFMRSLERARRLFRYEYGE